MPMCPYCHTVVSGDYQFCPECGRPLTTGEVIVGGPVEGKSKKKIAGIIVACVIAIIVIIVLFSIKPWGRTYTLSVSINPLGAGYISPSGGEYESGVQVILTAYPNTGYTFDRWSGSAYGTTPTTTITMDSDMSLTAHFKTTQTTPEILFSDDFSDEAGVWDTYSVVHGSVFYESGWLHLVNQASASLATDTSAYGYFTDFILEVETKLVAGTDNNWHSVYCRVQDIDNYYDFGISADGYYDIVKVVDSNQITFVSPTYSSHINQGVGAVNLIHIECIGSSLSLSVNGHLLWEGTDYTFNGGDIGLGTSALAGTFTEVAFDNIVVREP